MKSEGDFSHLDEQEHKGLGGHGGFIFAISNRHQNKYGELHAVAFSRSMWATKLCSANPY